MSSMTQNLPDACTAIQPATDDRPQRNGMTWRMVKLAVNPADPAVRGVSEMALVLSSRWRNPPARHEEGGRIDPEGSLPS